MKKTTIETTIIMQMRRKKIDHPMASLPPSAEFA
jgi:hypothetical protein